MDIKTTIAPLPTAVKEYFHREEQKRKNQVVLHDIQVTDQELQCILKNRETNG